MMDDYDDDERDEKQRRKEAAAAGAELDKKYSSSGDAQSRVMAYKKFRKVYRHWLNNTFEGRQEKDAREERIDALREKWDRQGR